MVVYTVEQFISNYRTGNYKFSDIQFSNPSMYSELLMECLKIQDGICCRLAAICYYFGKGAIKNDDLSFRYYQAGAYKGDKVCQHNVGYFYQKGISVAANDYEAVKWYQLAAKQGYSLSEYALCLCYRNGTGVEKDMKMFFKLIKSAADKDYSRAQAELARMYLAGDYFSIDYNMGFYYAQKAAQLNDEYGHYYCGVCYEHGLGTIEDHHTAKFHYLKAADKNVRGAMTAAAKILLLHRTGMSMNYKEEAKLLLMRAASLGDEEAESILRTL